MPEYLAPGVYVEEVSYRSKSIEGVSTTTTGFIGPTRYGPFDQQPDIITSLGQFERTYGDGERLVFGEQRMDNYVWHAARAFFTEGGKRLYVTRVFRPLASEAGAADAGCGRKTLGKVTFRARYPGSYGNFRVRLTLKSGANILGAVRDAETGENVATLGALNDRDLVWVRDDTSPPSPPSGERDAGTLYYAERDPNRSPHPWRFTRSPTTSLASPLASPPDGFGVPDLFPVPDPGIGDSLRVVTLTLELLDAEGELIDVWPDLPIDPKHRTDGFPDSIFEVFDTDAERLPPLVVTTEGGGSAIDFVSAVFAGMDFGDGEALMKGITREDIVLEFGNDGLRPGIGEYEGKDNENLATKTGLKQFEAIDDISIVAAPGVTAAYADPYRDEANAVIGLLLAHARTMRYRIAVIDSAQGMTVGDVRKMRAKLDSKYGALYFPWVKVMDPITRRPIFLPPSGFVAGVYARNDVERAVYKAPANEVVNLALGFEMMISKGQQEVLNPEGINCFRFFEGRGMLVWGARTLSSDPEWKYVNVRRYFIYLEHSIDRGTQWAVFEPNGERLWANVRRTVEDFLLNEWQMGALLGDKPEKAYFVRCDRGTMTQNDLDNGRLVCLIGVVALKPAEFVIFRIGQWTADRKV